MSPNHDAINNNEEIIPLDTFEYVELIIQPAIIEFVENLHPDKRIKDDSVEFCMECGVEIAVCFGSGKQGVNAGLVAKERKPSEIQSKGDCQLIDSLADDHFPHICRDQGGAFGRRFSIKDLFRGGVGCEGEGGKGVHDKVHP